jgi:L-serine dehydratase
MESLSIVYKIGHGPSSSHTIGPTIAAKLFKTRFSEADEIKVTLYGSLALTGKGHMTDVAIKKSLLPIASEIIFNALDKDIEHPNTMDFVAYKDKKVIGKNRIFSVGGGNIKIKGEKDNTESSNVYKENTFDEIKAYCLKHNLTLIQYIEKFEPKET